MTFFTQGKFRKWINLYIQDPLTTWKQAKKYFKKPKISVKIYRVTRYSGYPYATHKYIGKILDICSCDVQWKDKWDSPRHERNPIIWICLFRCIALWINFSIYYKDEFGEQKDESALYWEYLLDYLYYSKSLRIDSWWTRDSRIFTVLDKAGKAEDGSEDTRKPLTLAIPTHLFSLNKRGLKEFKKLYE